MSIDREPIWAALFQLLKVKTQSPFLVKSRKHVMPPELTPENQPAMFLIQGVEDRHGGPFGTGGTTVLHGFLMIYDYDTEGDVAPGSEVNLMATTLNGYLKDIDDALDPGPVYDRQTLGFPGVVEHCWVEGSTMIDQGIIGKQAFLQIPIHIQLA